MVKRKQFIETIIVLYEMRDIKRRTRGKNHNEQTLYSYIIINQAEKCERYPKINTALKAIYIQRVSLKI